MKKVVPLIKTFMITLLVAFMATSNENLVYSVLNNLGYENEVLKKTLLSAVITLIIGLTSLLGSFIWTKIFSTIKKMNVKMDTKINGRKKDNLKFTPCNSEYDPQNVEIEICLKPKGKLACILIKKLEITLDVYFNPEIVDVSYFDKWDNEEKQIFQLTSRKISINLLGEIDIKGRNFREKSHKLSERFVIKPIRVKNAETYLEYMIAANKFGSFGQTLANNLLDVEYKPLELNCEGE